MRKNKWIPYILTVAVLAILVMVYVFFNNSQIGPGDVESTEDAGMTIPEEVVENILSTTEIPEDLNKNAKMLKEHIKANGFEEDDYIYLGCLFSEDLYCSIRYYEEMDMLCLVNSYYTQTEGGASAEILATIDNFPYSSQVRYYEDFFAVLEEDDEKPTSFSTLIAEATYNPAEFTSSSSLEFATTEDSTYNEEEADMESVFNTAEKYSLMSFSFWDELLEIEFGVQLKDFGFDNFVREDYSAERAE